MENFVENKIDIAEVFVGGEIVGTNAGSTCGDEDYEDTLTGRVYYVCE